jgi:anti-sigma B factor antagonist
MPNPFRIHQSSQGDISIFKVEGYLDAHTAPEFERAIQAEIDAGRHRLIVDCEKLTYISSAGLGVFMGFIEEIREREGDIKICNLVPKVRQTFELLGFQQLYHILDSLPEAIQKFTDTPRWEG